jgi:hypothetical protein
VVVSKTLGYGDAVRLLGGQDSAVVSALDKIAGVGLLAAATLVPAVLGLLGAKAEAVRLGRDLLKSLSERRGGLSRRSRTQRLEAAHAVLVVTAYFEALEETALPFQFADLELTKAEQVAAAGSILARDAASLVDALLSVESLLPEPQFPRERQLELLDGYYTDVSGRVATFVRGLAVWDRLTETDQERFTKAMSGVAECARGRYEDLFGRLAGDFPEVACWANAREHQATRAEVRSLGAAMAVLERMLTEISTGRVPDERRASLARAYQAALDRPIVESGEAPEGLQIPTLGQAYVTPRFRAQAVFGAGGPSEESWWDGVDVREDLEDFLTGYLTSPRATRAPLLVLGQPGSGKSVLTRVLAARLPAPDFLPVRVVLRDVPAAADLQDQIEHAIRTATGESVDWPALARSAGDALPVVLLDGFDELLQATGVSQTDYLDRVAVFQRREADQDRPVAVVVVVVTSRTSVADRARAPQDTVALRLEPFDNARVTAWLATWNVANAAHLAARGLAPLPPETVLVQRELAEQPLLLLMLALYDADGNALQRAEAGLGRGELYQRLLHSFATREVVKHRPGLPDGELEGAVADELRRLSVVAFAMFNRGSQWVTKAELDADLPALFAPPTAPASGPGLRAVLRAAEIVLGRFFFVHRAQATRDEVRLETFEFLHATFAEYLVARLTWQVLLDVAARDAASTMSLGAAPVDDDLLHALLSFAALTARAPIVSFLTEMASTLDQPQREALTGLLVRLYQAAPQPRLARAYAGYRPRVLPVPARHAAYSANLLLLAVCAARSIRASELYGTQLDAVNAWHSQALLWHSQLTHEEWGSLIDTFAVDRLWDRGRRDVRLAIDDGTFQPPAVDLYWSYNYPPDDPERGTGFWWSSHYPDALRRKVHFQCGITDDVALHALEPLASTLGVTVNMYGGWSEEACRSAAHALLEVWLLPIRDSTDEERRTAYERCFRIATGIFPPEDVATYRRYAALLLDRLTTDTAASPDLAADVLEMLTNERTDLHEVAPRLVRCALAFLGHDRDSDQRIADVLGVVLIDRLPVEHALAVEACIRLAEFDLLGNRFDQMDELRDVLESVVRRRPDLEKRLPRLREDRGGGPDGSPCPGAAGVPSPG